MRDALQLSILVHLEHFPKTSQPELPYRKLFACKTREAVFD
jgi:hypothetical protein